MAIIHQSTVTCPVCGARKDETMPSDACLVSYTCRSCGALLRPKAGDCCVFCSYGSAPCPPVQSARRSSSR
ncbi:MAG TPA: GDCCVxC domain-containing (seleno)protein [Stellaceae bacterium]|nr:GDCCVxC domain-containing (seleno)protein [Stellaceae bacterium]